MFSTQTGVEVHLESILRACPPAWQNYKNHLVMLYNRIHDQSNFAYLRFDEGDCCIRFHVCADTDGLNRLYFIYEIGYVIPDIRWRGLIRKSSVGLAPILLSKKTVFLPAYNYSLDKSTTLIYWGEKQFFFNPEQLAQLDLKTLPICLSTPSKIWVSAANLIWPTAVDKLYLGSSGFADLTRLYLFNSLFAPGIVDFHDFWSESPFVLIGDREVELFGIHKTLCSVDLRTVHSMPSKDFVGATAYVIDRNLAPQKISCSIPRDSLPLFEENPIREAIATKYSRVHGETGSDRTITAISLHPFESSRVFEHESQGTLLTAVSLVLRFLYLRSESAVQLNSSLSTIHDLVLGMFRKFPFSSYKWTDVAAKIIMNPDGLKLLIPLLGVYQESERGLIYMHPGLLESALSLCSELDSLSTVQLRRLIGFLADWLARVERNHDSSSLGTHDVLLLEDNLRHELELSASFDAVRNAIRSMVALKNSLIPISKALSVK